MLRVAIVGIGFMGMIHYLAARKLRGARVTAICSRDPKKRAGDWRSVRGNFGPAGQRMDLSLVTSHERLETLLADPGIDLIDICTPTASHAEAAIRALEAGKNVLVEKPIALTPRDADAMLKAASRSRRLLMVGQVLPFFPEFAYAARVVRERRFGRLLAAHFTRVISRPDWSAESADATQSGGPAIDLHVHDTHFIRLIAGVPGRVFSTGVADGRIVQHLTTQYLYGPAGPRISCTSGALAQKGRPFVHGFDLYLERATLAYQSGSLPLTLMTPDGKALHPPLKSSDDPTTAFTAELQCAVNAVTSGHEPGILSSQLARDALVMCYRECQSVRTGRAVAAA